MTQKEEYSPFKIVHHPNKLAELRAGKQTTPLQIQLVPTNICNQRCHFCAYRLKGYLSNEKFNERDTLDFAKIKEIIIDMEDMSIPSLLITGGGEPLVYPDIENVCQMALDKNIELALITNGLALTDNICKILGNGVWVRISLDSSNPITYKFLKHTSQDSFNKVIKNAEKLVKYKKTTIIGMGFVIEKENYKEVLEAAKIAKNIGIDNFRISATLTPTGYEYFDSFKEEASALANDAELLSDNKFTVFNLFSYRMKQSQQNYDTQNYNFCPTKELMVYIGADYNVYMCCILAYNQNGFIGNIKDTTFKSLWMSAQKQKLYENHHPILHCKHPCIYKDKNEFINYCLLKNPKHINFI